MKVFLILIVQTTYKHIISSFCSVSFFSRNIVRFSSSRMAFVSFSSNSSEYIKCDIVY